MGSLAGIDQRNEVKTQVQKLLAASQIIYGAIDSVEVMDADAIKGAFISPLLLLNEDPFTRKSSTRCRSVCPVSTLMPYSNLDEAIHLSKLGKGSLLHDRRHCRRRYCKTIRDRCSYYARPHLNTYRECARESTGHGSPLPMLVHGGPGRAGGGEEMGGISRYKTLICNGWPCRALPLCLLRLPMCTSNMPLLIALAFTHLKKHYEELHPGDQLVTEKRKITAEDIDAFANLSGDHFYAHLDNTDF
jgi:oxepin-CoA hydrolase/3-oxo-5,6-dehydrosuberyl-CoA semialdehyde dehydrogenase